MIIYNIDNKILRKNILNFYDENKNIIIEKKQSLSFKISQEILNEIKSKHSDKNKLIALFCSFKYEPDISEVISALLKEKYHICFPCVESSANCFREITDLDFEKIKINGIFQPTSKYKIVDKKEIETLIVPTLAYNDNNFRFGYGTNFYNSFFAKEDNIYKILVG